MMLFLCAFVPVLAAPSVANYSLQEIGTETYGSVYTDVSTANSSYAVFVHYRSNNESVDSVYTDNDDFESGCFVRGNEYTTEVWYLIEPYQSFFRVYIDWTGQVEDAVVNVIEIQDVDTEVMGVNDYDCNGTSSFLSSFSVDTSPSDNDLVLSAATVYSPGSNFYSTASGLSMIYNNTYGNIRYGVLSADSTNSQITWTNTASWPWSAVSIVFPGFSEGGGGGGGDPISMIDSNYSQEGTTTDSSLTVYPSGSNNLLVAVAHYRSWSESLDQVHFGENYLTSTCVERNNEYTTEIWYLENAPDYAQNVDFYWTGQVDDVVVQAAIFDNVDSIADYNCNYNGGSPWSTLIDVDVTGTYSTQLLIGAATSYSGNFNTLSLNGAGTEIAADYVGNVSYAFAYQDPNGGTSTMSWTGGTAWPSSAIALLANSTGGEVDPGGGSPTISWDQDVPDDGSATFTVSGTATADEGVYDVYAEVCYAGDCYGYGDYFYGQAIDGEFNSISEDFEIEFVDLEYGDLDITIFVEDELGEITEYFYESIVVYEDVVGPSFSFTSFPNSISTPNLVFDGNALESETTISVVLIGYGPTGQGITHQYEATADDGYFDSIDEDFSYTIYGLEEGTYDIEVLSYNAHGGESSYTYTITVIDDENPPVITMGNLGKASSTDTTPTFTGTVSDMSVIESLQYRIYGDGSDEVALTDITVDDGVLDESEETFTITTPELTDGSKLVVIKAVDIVGNEFDNVVDRIIIDAEDTSAPIIGLQDIVPDPIADPSPVISGRVDDNTDELTSNISNLYFKVDDGAWQDLPVRDGVIGDEESEEFNIELMNLSLGMHSVTVRAVDAAGNDTNSGSNVTKTFEVIEQTEDLAPSSISTTVSFDSRTYYDSINNDLIWGNGQLRLSEVVDPVVTELISNDSNKFGDRYTNGTGVYDVISSASGGQWFILRGSEFAYVNPDQEVFMFDASTWGGSSSSEIQEIFINGEYHVWLTTGNRILGLNFGSNIENGVDSYVGYQPIGVNTDIMELDTRGESTYGVYFVSNNRLYYKDNPSFTNSIIAGTSGLTTRYGGSYYTSDVVELYLDEERDHLWIGSYAVGVQRLSDKNTPTDTFDDEVLNYAGVTGVFAIGVDKDGKPFFAGNGGLQIVSDDNDTDNNTVDDTLTTLVDAYDLNLGVASHVQYFAGDSIVPSVFYIANRTGSFYYFSSNGTYEDPIDDQLIEMNLVGDHYPAEIRRFHMPDDSTVYFSSVHKGAYRADLNKQFAESGYTQTITDSQISEYLDADYLILETVGRVDDSNAQVIYEVSNDGGVNWYEIDIGDVIDFNDNDYRISLRITMTRGSTPVLTDVQLSYAAYANEDPDERTHSNYGFVGIPSSVDYGESFSFNVQLLDELDKLLKVDDTATIYLKQSSNNQTVGSFSLSNLTFVDGVATIDSVSANVVGDHYFTVTNGSITQDSSNITFYAEESSGSVDSDDNKDDNNSEDSGQNETDPSPSPSPTPVVSTAPIIVGLVSPEPSVEPIDNKEKKESKPKIITFNISKDVVTDEKHRIKIEWEVENADTVEISGVGNNLPSKGERFIDVTEDTVLQLVARNDSGSTFSKKEYRMYQPLIDRIIPNLGAIVPGLDQNTQLSDIVNSISQVLTTSAQVITESVKQIAPISAGLATITIPTLAGLGLITKTAGLGQLLQIGSQALQTLRIGGQTTQASNVFSLKFISRFLRALGIIPSKKPNGVIYDSKTNKTVPFALLTFRGKEQDSQTDIIETVVTDVNGVFQSITLPVGTYSVQASHQDYSFPTENNRPPYFSDMEYYKGESFQIKSNENRQTLFIPVDQLQETEEKGSWKSSFNILSSYLALKNITYIMFFVSLLFTVLNPSIMNIVVICFYLVSFAYTNLRSIFATTISGKIVGVKGRPMRDVIVRLSNEAGSVISVVTTNENGEFKIFVKKQKYRISVYKNGYLWDAGMSLNEIDASSGSQKTKIIIKKAKHFEDMFK